jgi:cyclin-A
MILCPKEFSTNTTTSVEEPKYCYKTLENKNLLNTYSGEILDYIMVKEKDSTPVNSLIKHNIPVNLRAKMVDWMIEVLSSYKCTE